MCAWKCAVSQLSDTLHIYMHTSDTLGRCTFTCNWCVHINVHWCDCPMCSCKWGVSHVTEMCMKYAVSQVYDSLHMDMNTSDTRVTSRLHALDVCMQMFSDPTVWCVHINGEWAVRLKCAWKCAVSQLSDSLHIYMHTSDTRVIARLRACKRAVIRLSDVYDNCAVSPITDVCMKMCSEPIA